MVGHSSGNILKARRGFTLVELLVVIGIIGLLVSILLPSLSRARETANSVKCLSNVRQLGSVFLMYASDHRGRLPYRTASRDWKHQLSDWIYWQKKGQPTPTASIHNSNVLRYMGNPVNEEALRCPSDDWAVRSLNGNSAVDGPYFYSYAVSTFVVPNAAAITKNKKFDRSLNLASVKDAPSKVLLAEEDERFLNDGAFSARVDDVGNDYLAIRHDRKKKFPDDPSNWQENLDRRGNVAFLDFHAEYVPRRTVHDIKHLDPER